MADKYYTVPFKDEGSLTGLEGVIVPVSKKDKARRKAKLFTQNENVPPSFKESDIHQSTADELQRSTINQDIPTADYLVDER